MRVRKKLIEVALPLEAINVASAREKSIRHGHPSTLHLWWARRPLAAARAVLFAQLVDDPSAWPEFYPTEAAQNEERDKLFGLIEKLVKWENTTNERLLEEAREEIRKSWRRTCEDNRDHPRATELFDPDHLPAFHDPFAGGGAIPLEAQRLGLESHASDLNPVAVLINKAMIEIPPKFAGLAPVNADARRGDAHQGTTWSGAQGLAEDVRYYGHWMRDEAEKRIGHLYPTVKITPEMVRERPDLKKYQGRELTVIAWLWARTVRSPNPALRDLHVPLVSSFMLSKKKGKEAYVEPVVEETGYRFEVRVGRPPQAALADEGTKSGRGSTFRCVMSGTPVHGDYIKSEGQAGRMGSRLMAIVLEGDRARVYASPTAEHESLAREAHPEWKPPGDVPARLTGGTCVPYGLTEWGDLFTDRQLVALTTISDLVQQARERAQADALKAGLPDDKVALAHGGTGARAYGEAVGVYLGFSLDKLTESHSTICTWSAAPKNELVVSTFRRQALPMTWDFAEANPFATSSGSLEKTVDAVTRVLEGSVPAVCGGSAVQADAATQGISRRRWVSTDPPYYDNIGYADLSDFFYAWMRRTMAPIFPDLFATLAVPKSEELVATPYRHGGPEAAEAFFIDGMTRALGRVSQQAHPSSPVTIYYAFKQSETKQDSGTASTGWETFLASVIRAGFSITGTWPVRTERGGRSIGIGTNALASSIVLVCRPLVGNAPIATRREFLAALRSDLPSAIADLQRGNIAPVDLAQASIGPGMAIYTRYGAVKESDGTDLPVRTALQLINQVLDETLAEQEGDFDPDTRWALAWFEEYGMDEAEFDRANTLSTAKNTSVAGLAEAGIIHSGRGKVHLLQRKEMDPSWDPRSDSRLTIWEAAQHLIRRHETGGESAAAELLALLGGVGETARELAYRLYSICERKKWAQEAIAYNSLVTAWPVISRKAHSERRAEPQQLDAF